MIRKLTIVFLISLLIFSGCAYHADIVRTPDISIYNETVMFNNIRYVPLLRFCDYYSLNWNWDLVSQRIEISSSDKKRNVIFMPDSKLALVNGRTVELSYPVEYKSGTAYIPVKTALFVSGDVFGIVEKPALPMPTHRIKKVVIDPGHGGKDPGAISRYGTKEKNIVLDVSKRLKRHLERNGIQVIMTRSGDKFIPLAKRAAIANDNNADLFISVHANASRHSRARGFEVYYLSEATNDSARALELAENASLKFENNSNTQKGKYNDPTLWDLVLTENRRQSRRLAYYICNITSDELSLRKRGVKSAKFYVLKGASMPSVLIEVGFITNRREEKQLKERSFRERLSKALSDSIISYKKEYERTNGFSK